MFVLNSEFLLDFLFVSVAVLVHHSASKSFHKSRLLPPFSVSAAVKPASGELLRILIRIENS
jgi:hypothetical protein